MEIAGRGDARGGIVGRAAKGGEQGGRMKVRWRLEADGMLQGASGRRSRMAVGGLPHGLCVVGGRRRG